ncbi:MAG TPA: hypothetical protein PK450_03670 [Paracoccaceae bacterium]|nr:hypothetical protein [Paracoccaceae bacterium]
MEQNRQVRIHLGPAVLEMAQAGRHNFLNRLCGALTECGYAPEYRPNGFAERIATGARPGWSMFEMEPPEGERSLIFRRAYVAPFWQIDRTDRRWDWSIARAEFTMDPSRRAEAEKFAAYWRKRLYPDLAPSARQTGLIYVPLQGRLLEQRFFQSASPVGMLETVLNRFPDRPTVATLHPKLTPTEAEEAALTDLQRRYAKLLVVRRPAAELLAICDLVVAQNSAAAFEALFFRKRVLLFAGIDFHHPFASVYRDGLEGALDQLDRVPDYDGYLWWYLQRQSLNAGREDFRARTIKRLSDLGMELRAD